MLKAENGGSVWPGTLCAKSTPNTHPSRPAQAAEALDGSGKRFAHDKWMRSTSNPNAGYGITSVLEGGSILVGCQACWKCCTEGGSQQCSAVPQRVN